MVFESGMSTDQDTLADFCQSLKAIQARHSSVVQTMAQGVLELRESHTVAIQMPSTLTLQARMLKHYRISG